MLQFNSLDELRDCVELKKMHRYQFQKVMLNGKEVIACTTNQQYEDIIWGGVQEILEELDERYGTNIAEGDLASDTRNFILARLESEYGVEFVDVFTDY